MLSSTEKPRTATKVTLKCRHRDETAERKELALGTTVKVEERGTRLVCL